MGGFTVKKKKRTLIIIINYNNKQTFKRRISNRKETQCAEQVDKSNKQMYTRCRETTYTTILNYHKLQYKYIIQKQEVKYNKGMQCERA